MALCASSMGSGAARKREIIAAPKTMSRFALRDEVIFTVNILAVRRRVGNFGEVWNEDGGL